MLKCWSYRPEDRPTFRYCLDVLLVLKENTSDAIQITANTLNRPQNGERQINIIKGFLLFACLKLFTKIKKNHLIMNNI